MNGLAQIKLSEAVNIQRIAVLMTCFNRKDTTLRCLKTLYGQKLPPRICIDVFLVDDGSPDFTGQAVKSACPQIHVIQGSGNLYWGGGMRLAWDTAAAADYDFYLWLNDDVELHESAIETLLNDYQSILDDQGKEALVSGCVYCPKTGKTSYSGNNLGAVLEPTGVPQSVLHNNGNVVLVPKEVYRAIGNISKDFPHQMGDGDYGLRCRREGFGCFISSCYVGNCEMNDKPTWFDPELSLKKRWALLHAPTGMPPKERFVFCFRHEGFVKAAAAVLKLYACTFFPRLYFRLKIATKDGRARRSL